MTYAWTYDGIGRLTSETYTNAADANANYTDAYTFDLAGNRLTLTHTQSTPLNLDYTETSTYDANDRLLTVLHDANNDDNDTSIYGYGDPWFAGDNPSTMQTDSITFSGTDFNWDNILKQSQYTFDDQGRMTGATTTDNTGTPTTTITTFTYDPSGIRTGQTISQTVGSTTTNTTLTYLYDANNPTGYQQILEQSCTTGSNTTKTTYTLGLDVITQHDATNGTLTLLYDGHGSTRAIMSAAAAIVQRYAYSAYGNQIGATGLANAESALTSLLYSGELFDANLGMQYLRARFYIPQQGDFISFDSYMGNNQDPQALHRYLYANASPTQHNDPTGHFTLMEAVMVGRTIGALAGFTGAAVYNVKHNVSILSKEGLRNLLIGTVGGAVVGALAGAAVFAVTAGGTSASIMQVLRTGVQSLWNKWFGPLAPVGGHPTTEIAAFLGFTIGFLEGLTRPHIAVGIGAAVGTASDYLLHVSVVGFIEERYTIFPNMPLWASSAFAFLNTYVAAGSFIALGFGLGFTTGYAVGSTARIAINSIDHKLLPGE
jgi:RHS repeat-associated protein